MPNSTNTIIHKPVVAISACLMGQNVRYDGGHKYNELIETILKPVAQITTFCPEVAAGLGTPRPAVRLVQSTANSGIRAIGVEDPSLDVTDALLSVAHNYVTLFAHVNGIIFKARSPSCGYNSTSIKSESGEVVGSGLFAKIIADSCPHLSLIDEENFMNKKLRDEFMARLSVS